MTEEDWGRAVEATRKDVSIYLTSVARVFDIPELETIAAIVRRGAYSPGFPLPAKWRD